MSLLFADETFASIVLELPNLFKVKTLPKSSHASKSSHCMRPSNLEIKNAFCLHVNVSFCFFCSNYLFIFIIFKLSNNFFLTLQTISEIQEKVQLRKDLITKYKFPNQPIPVLLGAVDNLVQYFIVYEDYRWEVAEALEAFFGAFSLYFGLDSAYPAEARHLFVFLQKTLFQLDISQELKKDRGLNSVLAARIKQFEIVSKQKQ